MNIEKLIHDLRARINPQYYDQLGTESYERHQVVKALEYLATENKRLKELMAKRTREHQQEMTGFRLRVRSQDDATFAALREENERLKVDAERYRWLRDAGATFYTGGPEITDGSDKVHVCEFAMDAAIDAAKRKLQQPEQVPGAERYIDRLIAEEK